MNRYRWLQLALVVVVGACSNSAESTATEAPMAPTTTAVVVVPGASPPSSTTTTPFVFPEFVPPVVAPPPGSPFYEGQAPHFEYVAGCMAEAGFLVEYVPETRSLRSTSPSDIQKEVEWLCIQAPIEQGWVLPYPFLEDDGLRLRYRLWLMTYQCMLEHGYPTLDPPSEDSFVSEGGRNWHPYGALPTRGILVVTRDEARAGQVYQLEIQETCTARLEDMLYDYEREHDGVRPGSGG